MNLCKATVFLLFQTLHKPVDSFFLALGIQCIKKLIILRVSTGIPPLRVTGRLCVFRALLHLCI
jgi:hypothetical protein